MRNILLATLLVVLPLAGCLGVDQPEEGEGKSDEHARSAPVVQVGSRTQEESLSTPSVHPRREAVGEGWTLETPANLLWLRLDLDWTNPSNRFGLEVEGPGGAQEFPPPPGETTVLQVEPSDLVGGAYEVHATSEGITVPDNLTLNATWTWLAEPGATEWVDLRQVGDQWEASITYRTSGALSGSVELEIDTFNGALEVAATQAREASVELAAWARAATREAATAAVKDIDVRLCLCSGRVVATAEAADGSNRGAAVDAAIPTAVSGGMVDSSNGPVTLRDLSVRDLSVDTSNGPIEVSGVEARDTSFDTSNGPVEGDLQVSGDLHVDTSNGPIELSITPTASGAWSLDSSNGPVTLRLKEGSSIAYDLDAHTSNGDISEDMDEASLDGDEDDATLTTSGGAGRSIQVTGTVETSNADVRFEGL